MTILYRKLHLFAVVLSIGGANQWKALADMRSSLQNVPELHFSIQQTWYGTPRGGPTYNFTIYQESNGELPIHLEAPFYNEPEAPRSTRMGGFIGLLNYEAFEMQFIGDDNHCLHVIVGPILRLNHKPVVVIAPNQGNILSDELDMSFNRIIAGTIQLDQSNQMVTKDTKSIFIQSSFRAGHYIIFLMYNEQLNIKDDLRMAYDSKVSYTPPYWKATIKIPLDYFPRNVNKFNAATRHGLRERRSMDVLYIDDEPLPSYFMSPPFRTAKGISLEKVLLNYDNSKISKVWERAIDEYRNAPRDTSTPVVGYVNPGPLAGALFLAYTLAYVVFMKYM